MMPSPAVAPSLAVIIAVRDGMPFLPETLASIRMQRYPSLQVVVVNDGSKDGTRDYLRSVRDLDLRTIEVQDAGPAKARNAGLRASTSDLVAFLDADDLWPPNTLARLTQALAEHPEAGIAQGMIRNFRETPQLYRHFVTPAYHFINLGSMVWRRSIFDEVGLLDEELSLCEDMDFVMRCWEHDIVKVQIDAVVLHYRRHPRGVTHGLSGAGFGTVRAYRKRIDRIRRGEFNPEAVRYQTLDRYVGQGPRDQDGKSYAPSQ
jgi:glycosyltransferase involved in cell wall biosynthesis